MNEQDKEQQNNASANQTENWEREIITRLALSALNEQKKTHRWSLFFKVFMAAYLLTILMMFLFPYDADKFIPGKHTAVIDISGVISSGSSGAFGSNTIDAETVNKLMRKAFKDPDTAGVILRINSPGGSAVQSAYIYDEITRLREKYPDTKIYAVVTDICASGGYYIASATNEIYASKASLVGSIGVIMNGFGFVDTLKSLGIERRLYTAGEHKGFLDAFSPQKPEEVKHLQRMLDQIHQQFIAAVKQGRGTRLKDDPKIFSGLIWTGEESKELGLIDGFGDIHYVAREIIGEEDIVHYAPKRTPLETLLQGMANTIKSSVTELESPQVPQFR
jgi:protease-4